MKLTKLLTFTGGVVVGYVLGAAAGRARYEQLKQGANEVLHHPKVQQTVYDLAGQAKAKSQRLPDPVADLVDTTSTRLQNSLTKPNTNATAPGTVPETGQ